MRAVHSQPMKAEGTGQYSVQPLQAKCVKGHCVISYGYLHNYVLHV